MSKIIFRFFSLIAFIALLNIANLRQSEAMLSDTREDERLTLGQRIVKEVKNDPRYEPKNYGRNTRKPKQVVPAPKPKLTPQQLEAQRQAQQAAAAQKAQQLQAQREVQEKARQEQQEISELKAVIQQFTDSPHLLRSGFWEGMPTFIEEASPHSIFQIPFEFLSKDDKEEFAKLYIYSEKPDFSSLLDKIEPVTLPLGTITTSVSPQYIQPLPGVEIFHSALTLVKNQEIVNSVLNASGLAYELEDKPLLHADKVSMLTCLNKGIRDGFWSGVDCFDVVTGNYGRYLKKKSSGQRLTAWSKQPALIASSKADGYPLILVAFKGTSINAADLVSDLKAFSKDLCNLGDVHAGFYDIADSCKRELAGKIHLACQRLCVKKSDVQILFTGHSMGAAVAAISSINQIATLGTEPNALLTGDLNAKNNVVVINLGQPRIWKKVDAHRFSKVLGEDNCVRLVAADHSGKEDTFTGYRPKDTLGYHHFGHKITKEGDLSVIFRATGFSDIHKITYYQQIFGEY